MAFVGGRTDGKLCGLVQGLIDAEVIPPEATRVIIDIGYNKVARVLYDCHAQEEMVDHPDLVKALLESQPVVAEVVRVDPDNG